MIFRLQVIAKIFQVSLEKCHSNAFSVVAAVLLDNGGAVSFHVNCEFTMISATLLSIKTPVCPFHNKMG